MAIPKFTLPFRLNESGGFAWAEQDTVDEIATCAETVVRYPVGFRQEAPTFGSHQLLFDQVPVDVGAVQQAIGAFEPRAHAVIDQVVDPIEQSQVYVGVYVDVSIAEPANIAESVAPAEAGASVQDATDTTRWSVGAVAPVVAANGDLHLDPSTDALSRFVGTATRSGAKWITGTGAPGADVGNVADWYLDLATGDVYELQGAGGHVDISGDQWLSGTGVPADEGRYGDWYLDTATGDIYLSSPPGVTVNGP